jgi:tellurite resistance-related uncharacterized protein
LRQPFWKAENAIAILQQLGRSIEGLWQLWCSLAGAQWLYLSVRLGKLRSLCVECHNSLDRSNAAPRFPVNADGTPSDPKHWWNVGS